MEKEFNTEGRCFPKKHFMVDLSAKIDAIFLMIEKGKYFTINRPHQYGKSTLLSFLSRHLSKKEDYLPISISFEGLSGKTFQEEENFIEDFLSRLEQTFSIGKRMDLVKKIKEEKTTLKRLNHLGTFLTNFLASIDQKTVLMIDEVDRSSNNELLLQFLGLLRQKYLLLQGEEDITFHSVILVGVHDVKSLKGRILSNLGENQPPTLYNSPWNIAADFEVNLSLKEEEIQKMLEEYVKERKVTMNIPDIAQKLYYYTSGHPFLTSKLCKIMDEKLMKDTQKWTLELVEAALQQLLKETNTNFEHLIKNLGNHSDLYKLVEKIILDRAIVNFSGDNAVTALGLLYGIFRNSGYIKIHNRVYEQRIYQYISANFHIANLLDSQIETYNAQDNFLTKNGTLNFEKVLLKFQEFMKTQYSGKDRDFLEQNGRLVFLSFLKPILNGKGFDFKEAQTSEEKRMDVVVTFLNQRYVVELKLWRGKKQHEKGLLQLADYLDCLNMKQGYLVIFDLRTPKYREWKMEKSIVQKKKILAAWV